MKAFFEDFGLYLAFIVVIVLLFILLGTPVVAPLFEWLSRRVGQSMTDVLLVGTCWAVICFFLCRFEYRRGYWETRVGPFSYPKVAIRKFASMALVIGLLFGAFVLSQRSASFQPALSSLFTIQLVSTVLAICVATYAVMMAGFVLGRQKYVRFAIERRRRAAGE